MSEQTILTKFKQNYPEFTGTLENSNDPTILLLKILAESECIGQNYYDYYMSEEYNMNSYLATKLFNYNRKLNIPYKYDVRTSIKISDNINNRPLKIQLPKYTTFRSKNSNYILKNSVIVNNYSSTESLILIQGEMKDETINSQTIVNNSERQYRLSVSDYIYPNIGYLEIDGVRYTEYSIVDAKYSDSKICYGVELSDDENYYLILSQKLFDKIMANSKITLNFLIKDVENDGETFTELTTDQVIISDTTYDISIDQITITSKIRDQLMSTTLLDFDTNISKFDYEENVNSLDSVILAKTYDCSDIITNSIVELDSTLVNQNEDLIQRDPSTWDVKLIFEERDENGKLISYPKDKNGNYIPVPYYMYIVVASADLYTESTMSLQLKREIMNSLQNGLCIKEVLMDYGTESRSLQDISGKDTYTYHVSVGDQGYKLTSDYRPYQLPFIVDYKNSLEPISSSEIDTKVSRYRMPDMVIQLEPASYVPVDIEIQLDLSYDSLDDLVNFYLSLIDSIKALFELSKSNTYLQFNSKLVKSDIDKVIYQYPEVNYAIIQNFIYYRNNVKSDPVKEIQFAPFELPVLGKLTIYLDVKQKSLSDQFIINDRNLNLVSIQQYVNDKFVVRDSNAKILLKLSDSLNINDTNIKFEPTEIQPDSYQIGLTYWVVSVTGDQEEFSSTTSSKSIISVFPEYNESVDDDPKFEDDDKTFESGLFTDHPKHIKRYLDY